MYFKKFPRTIYNKNVCLNIFARLRIAEAIGQDNQALLPYTVKDGERADQIAYTYYNDPYLDWVIYLSNNLLDPNFDWPLSEAALGEFIIEKYGSIDAAQKKILFYRAEWSSDESVLSVDQYSVLADNIKKFWSPTLGYDNQVVFYERKQADWTVATNIIMELLVNSVSGFETEERVTTGVAFGDVVFIDSSKNSITIKNVGGTGVFNNVLLTGDTSGATTNITGTNVINVAIDPSESNYWQPVTAYDYENELNQQHRNIVLLDKNFVSGIDTIMSNLLAG